MPIIVSNKYGIHKLILDVYRIRHNDNYFTLHLVFVTLWLRWLIHISCIFILTLCNNWRCIRTIFSVIDIRNEILKDCYWRKYCSIHKNCFIIFTYIKSLIGFWLCTINFFNNIISLLFKKIKYRVPKNIK